MAGPKVSWERSVAIITGGSKGIGRVVAERAVARGARVGLIARHRDELEQTLAGLGGSEAGAVAVADVAVRNEVVTALAGLQQVLGPPDILVNNAGIGAAGAVATMQVSAIERVMQVNYLGMVYATKAVLPGMLRRGRGHVVNMASVGGRFAAPGEAAYSATKFAIVGFTQALALELHHAGVGVSLIDPGPVDTGFFDNRGADYQRRWPRKVSASRVASAVVDAIDRGRLEVFVPSWYRAVGIVQAAMPGVLRAVPPSVFGIVPDPEIHEPADGP